MSLPLDGIRVLDMGRYIAAPWAGQVLGDLGADVIKLERTGSGDPMRAAGPIFHKDRDGQPSGDGTYMIVTNRNKRSLTVDLAKEEGQRIIRDLVARSDVLIENYKVGDLARYGLDYSSLKDVNPGLVYCSITGFGQSGPYSGRAATDSVFQAMSGLMSVTGEPDRPAQKVGVTIVDVCGGLYAGIAILAALRHREVNGGAGQHLDIALLDTAVAVTSHKVQDYLLSGEVPVRTGGEQTGVAPAGVFPTRDGAIILQGYDDASFKKLCAALGLGALANDPRYATTGSRWQARDSLHAALDAVFRIHDSVALATLLAEAGVMAAPVYTIDQTFRDPQVVHRGLRRAAPHPNGADVPLIASPMRFSGTPIERYRAPPMLGEHSAEILDELLGIDAAALAALRRAEVV